MKKSHTLPMKRLESCLMELKNYLPSFPGSNDSKKVKEEDTSGILLHTIPNGWRKQA